MRFVFCWAQAPWHAVRPGEIEEGFSARVYGPSDQGHSARVVQQPFGGDTIRRDTLFRRSDGVSLDDLASVFWTFKGSS